MKAGNILSAETSQTAAPAPDKSVIEYAIKNGRKAALLYNNRLLSLFKPANGSYNKNAPSVKAAEAQYDVNRDWILKNFPK